MCAGCRGDLDNGHPYLVEHDIGPGFDTAWGLGKAPFVFSKYDENYIRSASDAAT